MKSATRKIQTSPLAVELTVEIDRSILSLEAERVAQINVDYISNVVYSRLDQHHISPKVIEHCSVMHIKQMVRAALRHTCDPWQRVADEAESGQLTMFDGILQNYYPAEREVMGDKQSVYVRRDLLTHDDVEAIVSRMRMVGLKLLEHCDALLAWDATRHDASAK